MLKEKGIAATVQRVAILEQIYGRRKHPSVEEVYSQLKKTMPALSKTTVYATLQLFAEKQLVGVVRGDGAEVHYDGVADFHAHFKCRRCGGIFDIGLPGGHLKPFATLPAGFAAENEELIYYGLCPKCSNKKGKVK